MQQQSAAVSGKHALRAAYSFPTPTDPSPHACFCTCHSQPPYPSRAWPTPTLKPQQSTCNTHRPTPEEHSHTGKPPSKPRTPGHSQHPPSNPSRAKLLDWDSRALARMLGMPSCRAGRTALDSLQARTQGRLTGSRQAPVIYSVS